jgi:phosphohistidine phosphatase
MFERHMDLYLVRHANAGVADPSQWPDDRDRPLTPKGTKRFKKVARELGELVSSVDVVLSSRFVRAWQTAQVLSTEAGWPEPLACEALESGRSPAEVLQALQAHTSAAAVALVGHEPNMHELVSYLLTADTTHAQVEFKKGGAARVSLDESLRPGSARLVWLLAPKVLVG